MGKLRFGLVVPLMLAALIALAAGATMMAGFSFEGCRHASHQENPWVAIREWAYFLGVVALVGLVPLLILSSMLREVHADRGWIGTMTFVLGAAPLLLFLVEGAIYLLTCGAASSEQGLLGAARLVLRAAIPAAALAFVLLAIYGYLTGLARLSRKDGIG